MSAWVQLKGVDLRYGAFHALKGVDLRIAPGEHVALIGANGSGKSTLLRVLHGLLKASAGSVLRDGALRQAMVFQRPYALRASVLTNVALGLWLGGRPWKAAREDALAALGKVGLANVALRDARTLSGGQLQHMALARAWGLRPHVLLLDEPTASLDPHAKREVESLMADFAEAGMTLVFASHNLGQVKRLATRVVYLEQGRVLADLPVKAFFEGPLGATSREAELFVRGELG
ncbi:phosphate ABC transporter ATP-binding protein [Ramlibacter sp. G-1-2-2]|uniref:Phosphate ABC transporter ATP-binding protein n=1 Tax=Ramlibacter agri TaxID=2728837 RepID=A0A848HB67_9BURK|nr:phosphate ABC transporter ATP-binding protein [Ramlibacter agri]NML46651.1 phosphate ABC transporter ATP-binding protein [Ramlibacter agri]